MAPHTHKMLISACVAASVELGAYDRRIMLWLSGWEPQTCAVVTGLITRAHEAGLARAGTGLALTGDQAAMVARALADAEKYRRDRAGAWCGDCEQHPAGACPDHVDDLDRADAYRDLAAGLPQPREGGAR
jgi:hypothetical protein